MAVILTAPKSSSRAATICTRGAGDTTASDAINGVFATSCRGDFTSPLFLHHRRLVAGMRLRDPWSRRDSATYREASNPVVFLAEVLDP
ncbi:MAG TPA: hypothetical protein VH022_13035 [Candidatus Acidoferrum sp.]|jgi:hypothetical protein|nr:hypothetical protein [Candidatus Acidoferrum sp.]